MTAVAQRLTGLSPLSGRLAFTLDPFRVALALLIIINVSRIHQHFGVLAVLRPAMALAFTAALYAFLNPRQVSLKGLLDTRPARLILAMFLLACLSAPFGLSLGGSGRYILESYSKVIVGALLLIAAIRSGRDLYTFVWAYVIGCGIVAWLSIFVFGLSQSGGARVIRMNDLYTYDSNDIGVVMMVGLGLTLLVLHVSRGVGKLAAIFVLVGIGITIARSGSRGALVGAVATGAALLLLLRTVPVWKRAAAIVVTTVTLMLAAPPGYWEQMETLLSPKEDYNWTSDDGRKQIVERGLNYMLGYPLFGLGINNFWRAECLDAASEKVRARQIGHGIQCTAPHNSYVQAGAELGIPGLTIWVMLVFGGIRRMLQFRKRMPEGWRRGAPEERFLYQAPQYLAVSMVGFAVTSFFVSFAWLDIIYILTAFMAGLYVCVDRRLREAGGGGIAVPQPVGRAARRAVGYRRSVAPAR